jgi:molybdopterin/thiamine biosynthesis adenylyltransferase
MTAGSIASPARRSRTACLVGLGNVGSQLVPLLARARLFDALTLVDPDRYDERNLYTQHIAREDVGAPKAFVQARVARAIDPALRVTALDAAVEDVPLGRLRADVIVSAPDTRRARQHANRIAWRLGIPVWIDAGIDPASQLVRVSLYAPAAEAACLECGWGPADYAAIAERQGCSATGTAGPATNGPPALGALAAARVALLCGELLADGTTAQAGTQITLAVREHRLAETRLRRDAGCRFDHARLPAVARLVDRGRVRLRELLEEPGSRVFLDGCGFARRTICDVCHDVEPGLRVIRPAAGPAARCPCGGRLGSAAFDALTAPTAADLDPGDLDRPLAAIGLEAGDLIRVVRRGGDDLIELAGGVTGARDHMCGDRPGVR